MDSALRLGRAAKFSSGELGPKLGSPVKFCGCETPNLNGEHAGGGEADVGIRNEHICNNNGAHAWLKTPHDARRRKYKRLTPYLRTSKPYTLPNLAQIPAWGTYTRHHGISSCVWPKCVRGDEWRLVDCGLLAGRGRPRLSHYRGNFTSWIQDTVVS